MQEQRLGSKEQDSAYFFCAYQLPALLAFSDFYSGVAASDRFCRVASINCSCDTVSVADPVILGGVPHDQPYMS